MSFIRELDRMQQNIKELAQTFEILKEHFERISPPEYPNELREPDTKDLVDPEPRSSIDNMSPQEWDSVFKRFYREPES